MKVLAVNSSPRKKTLSKTGLMLENLVQGMRDAGAEVDVVDILDKTIDYCTGCFACFNKKFNETELCIHKDDMTSDLLPKWKAANLVVYASPVFFHSVTAKLKTFFERTLPVYVSFNSGEGDGQYNPGGETGHPALAFLAVSGSPEDTAFDDYAKYVRCFGPVAEIYRNGSTLMSLPFCRDRVDDVLAATRLAGMELVRDLRISDATMARIRQPLHDDAAFIAKIADAHQTLLPGHRAVMTFRPEAKRELRKLPSIGAAAIAPAPTPAKPRRRVIAQAEAASSRHDETLARLRAAAAEKPAAQVAPVMPVAAEQSKAEVGIKSTEVATDIAIVGMSGRFASAADLDALWRVLQAGQDLVEEATRWDLRTRYEAEPAYGRHGGFLKDIDRFDAVCFKIAGSEARYMDPQQRIFLEEAWHALENAGYASDALSGTRCGVYVGCGDGDYRALVGDKAPPQSFWGNAASVIPARIAYYLNLKGPAIAIDTACSSSLVAIHMACQALRSGEVDMAVSGGVFVQCTPRLFDAANNAGMLSPSGRCHTFDARADGFVIGEGAGAVILKRLADARAAGDHIHGVIKASGINQDGTTNGLTAPSALSQEQLIAGVYQDFAIDPETIDFVECHGTGTRLGDPIEFNALARAFQSCADRPGRCAIGSIKTNVGHAGSAAGVAGLLKVLLALRHRTIPASLHFERANPLVGLEGSPFSVNTTAIDWPANGASARRAAVSSFGFSGTNAHVVIEEAPTPARRLSGRSAHLVALSSRTPDQLKRSLEQLRAALVAAGPDLDLGHISFTLLVGRKHGRCRFACVVRDRAELLACLANAAVDARSFRQHDDDIEKGDLQRERAGNAVIALARQAQGDKLFRHLETIADHYRAGDALQYGQLFEASGYGRVPLPGTPFDRKSYWADAVPALSVREPPVMLKVDATVPVGDTLLVPVFDPVDLVSSVPAAGATVILASPGFDPDLCRNLRRGFSESLVVELDGSLDDVALRARLDAAVDPAARVIWLAPRPLESPLASAALLAAQESGVLLLFRAVRALLDAGYGARPLEWTVITQQTASIHGEMTHPDHAGLVGLVGSLSKEAKRWTMRVADLGDGMQDGAELPADLGRLPMAAADTVFYGRGFDGGGRRWYRRRLVPASTTGLAKSPYRKGGVFVVFGGAGGIGRTWTEHVIREAQAQVVWIGRRPLDSEIEAELDRLALLGPRPHYVSADCTLAEEVERARAEIRTRFGAVHGLVHSAIVLSDGATATMSAATFRKALEPKIDLSVHSMRAFRDERLDFVLFFSSMISFTASAGQANYAAGCTFKDAFAERLRQELDCPVKVMNWGYWGHVGIVSGESYRSRMAELGVASIETATAMRAIDALFSCGEDQLAFFRTAKQIDIPQIDALEHIWLVPSPPMRSARGDRLPTGDEIRMLRPQLHILQEIEAAIAPVIAQQLARSVEPRLPYLAEWRREAEAILVRQPEQRMAGDAWTAWDRKRAAWQSSRDHHVRCELVDATARALPGILAGTVAATDVLFPQGSMRLVEGLYQQNQVADAFNRWVAETVVADIEELAARRPSEPIRILEIGAGTGGTTSMVLQRLHETGLQAAVGEYRFTDVSSAFLRHARDRFGAANHFLQFQVLDVEAPMSGQGIAEATYDIVIAANVLHATQQIRLSVRHAKAALRPGGLLVLNELSRHTLLSHLTFGLLEGWWSARDRSLRLPGGPALSPSAWKAVLSEEGFEGIAFPARDAHGFGQQVIAARGNGVIRRSSAASFAATPSATEETQELRAPVSIPDAVAPEIAAIATARYEELVLRALSECLGVELGEIERDEAFSDYGLDSLNAVQLVQSLNQSFGTALKPSDLYSHASAARLARHLAATGPAIPQPAPAHNAALSVDTKIPRADDLIQVDPDAVAIIGVSARFAGAETMGELWQALRSGRSLVTTSKRWPGATHRGAFFDDITTFDPSFFNISGVEAAYMDPQQRFFLEEAWKAIEDAGYAGEGIGGLRGRDVGVFVGCYPSDYFQLTDERAPAQAMWGSATSIVPARLAYFLDLRGPAVAIDTACSSSLVAIHQACRSMAAGECEMAIAGGVTLHSTVHFFDFAGRAGMLSASGRSHAFEARADGFAAGEGVGVVVLKPLARAIADGDHIHGVIRGTGINQDGASNGIIAPNGEAQLRLLRKTHESAGIDPRTIQLVEAHGTGTRLGDPIEFDALQAQFAGVPRASCVLGSIKANVGHTLAAAGIAGLVKTLLALRYKTLPPAPDFQTPNPLLALQDSPFFIPTEPVPWPESQSPRRAVVSSFGFSGTNAHAIVDEAPRPVIADTAALPRLFVLSAASAAQLRQLALKVEAHCREARPDLAAMSFTLLIGRRHLAHRIAWVASTNTEFLARLTGWLAGDRHAAVVEGVVEPGRANDSRPGLYGLNDLSAWATQFVEGGQVPVEELFPAMARRRIPLPTYPFAVEHYWVPEAAVPAADRRTPETARPQTMWHTAWRSSPIVAGEVARPARSIILATPQTQLLAQRIARHLPGSTVISASDETQASILEDADTLIDCAGCAPVAAADFDWLVWPQRLAQASPTASSRYLCVTRGLVAVEADDAIDAPDGRVLRAALARMLQSEYRRVRSAHIDFATTASDEAVVNGILAELSVADSAAQIAHRDGGRFTPSLVEMDAPAPSARATEFPADRVLWITGGTRGLGLLCARHFATTYGVKRIVLTGQKPVAAARDWPELAKAGTASGAQYGGYVALQEQGVELEVMALDLSDDAAVQRAVEGVAARLGPIGGLLHCAGVADGETLAFSRKSADGISRVLAPKTRGLDVMWRALQGQPLDFAILFSSLTAAVPALAVGQSDYAMANAYLDAFARYQAYRTHPRPPAVISVQWPNWKESGMGEVLSEALAESGFAGLSDREGLALLDRILAARNGPVVLPAVMSAAPVRTAKAVLPSMAPRPDCDAIDDWLSEIFSAELRIAREKLNPATPFPDYGADSILLAQIHKTLGRALQCDLDPTLLYTHATLESLAAWLRENHASALGNVTTSPAANVASEVSAAPKPVAASVAASGAIAIVGMACRFPGAPDLDAYWNLLRSGSGAIAPVPDSRWKRPASVKAALLDEIDRFDPDFFGIGEADARAMSAQARISLEVALATFCHAGYRPEEIKGQQIGVYLGARAAAPPSDELLEQTRYPVRAVGQNYVAAGISQYFDLHGPSMVIDTACSSALVAMQSSIQAMRCGDLEAALVGGVSILDTDGPLRMFHKRALYSENGAFHVFDGRADGVVLGEGCGMVLLKPLELAQRDGDTVYAVVDAVAVNSDGRSAGPSAPNIAAQIAVMQTALRASGKDASDISHIEVNGSGGEVSDLLELKAMLAAYGMDPAVRRSLGSIKPNIGHPLCAQGIASVIKVACMLHHQTVAPFQSAEVPMRHFDFKTSPFIAHRTAVSWAGDTRVAAVSTFADGGTNAHVILSASQEALQLPARRAPLPLPPMTRRRVHGHDAAAAEGEQPAANFWLSA